MGHEITNDSRKGEHSIRHENLKTGKAHFIIYQRPRGGLKAITRSLNHKSLSLDGIIVLCQEKRNFALRIMSLPPRFEEEVTRNINLCSILLRW